MVRYDIFLIPQTSAINLALLDSFDFLSAGETITLHSVYIPPLNKINGVMCLFKVLMTSHSYFTPLVLVTLLWSVRGIQEKSGLQDFT